MGGNFDFKNYRLKLEVISPIHIGTGEDYEPVDYIIKDGRLHFLKRSKVADEIYERGKLEEFLDVTNRGNLLEIRKFLYKFISENFSHDLHDLVEFSVEVSKIFQRDYEYKLKNKTNERDINWLGVKKLLYTKYFNIPVIPGSSIKGALRTVLDVRKKVKFNDMKFLKISDFRLVKGNSKIDLVLNRKRDNRKGRGIPEYLEFFKLGTILIGEFSVGEGFPVKFRKIVSYINEYFKDVYTTEISEFDYKLDGIDFNGGSNSFYMKLGKHTGAYSKYFMKKGKRMLQKSFWKTAEDDLPLGWAKFTLIDGDSPENVGSEIEERKSIGEKTKNVIDKKKSEKADPEDIKKLLEKYSKNK